MTVYALGSGVQGSPGRVGRMRMSNRARTQAEMSQRFLAGVPEADRGASNLNVNTNSGFETNTTGYDGITASISRNTSSPISGTADLLVSISSTSTGGRGVRWLERASWVPYRGKRVRLRFDYIVLTSGLELQAYLWTGSGTPALTISGLLSSMTVANVYFDFVVPADISSSERLCIFRNRNSVVPGDYRIDNVEIYDLGLTADYAPTAIQLAPGQWHDSANKKHFHVPDGFRLGNPATEGQLRGRMSWSASTDPRYISGVNGNVVPANARAAYITAVATVSGTFNIGDGVTADLYAAGVTIGTSQTEIALSTRYPGATNRKLVFTPTSSYSGTVEAAARFDVTQ